MILTSYYKFARGKSKTRFDEVTSTKDYNEFEINRNKLGVLSIKYATPDYIKRVLKKKPTNQIKTSKGDHISDVHFGYLSPKAIKRNNPITAQGHIKQTNDQLIFVFNKDFTEIEIFIAVDQELHYIPYMFFLFSCGQLDWEKNVLKMRATGRF